MSEPWLTIVQFVFIYALLWWIAFFCMLQWAIPDFWFRLPWLHNKRVHYLTRQPFGTVTKKFIMASLIALVATAGVLPLVKSQALSFEVAASRING